MNTKHPLNKVFIYCNVLEMLLNKKCHMPISDSNMLNIIYY